MKTRICLAGLALVLLLAIPAKVFPETQPTCTPPPNYMNLINHTEKWFSSEIPGKMVDLRLHTLVKGTFNGAVILERDVLLGTEVIESKRLLFNRTETGDIMFYGDLDTRVLPNPVMWVDAPLSVGKTWIDQTPAYDNGIDPEQMIHYVYLKAH